jgi:hypothetical protein
MSQEWKQLRVPYHPEEFPISIANAHRLLVRALELGNVEVTGHFKQRGTERNFTTVDAENILRKGTICRKPIFDPAYENYCFNVRGKYEGRTLELKVALDPGVDYDAPLLIFITGIRKGGPNADNDNDEK